MIKGSSDLIDQSVKHSMFHIGLFEFILCHCHLFMSLSMSKLLMKLFVFCLLTAVHEKMFVVFMVSSLCYMLCNTICFKMSRSDQWTQDVRRHSFGLIFCIANTLNLSSFMNMHIPRKKKYQVKKLHKERCHRNS